MTASPAVFPIPEKKHLRPLQGVDSPPSRDSLREREDALDIEEEWDYYHWALSPTLHSAVCPTRAGRTIPVNLRYDSLTDLHKRRDALCGSLRG